MAGEAALNTGLDVLGTQMRRILVAVQQELRAQAEERLLAVKAELDDANARCAALRAAQDAADLENDTLKDLLAEAD